MPRKYPTKNQFNTMMLLSTIAMKPYGLFIILFCSIVFIQANAQGDQSKSNSQWKLYSIEKSDMQIKFPVEPDNDIQEITKDLHQYTRKVYIKDSKGFNFVYFVSIVNYKNGIDVDSATFIRTATTMLNNRFKNSYSFTITKENHKVFKNCSAISVTATVKPDPTDSFIYNAFL